MTSHNHCTVGTVRIRSFTRTGDQRAFIKVAEPNKWRLRAHVVWESENGAIPAGFAIHHRDRNKLNDALSNLELLSVARHLAEHRDEFRAKSIAALVRARKKLRWSTKSTAKRTGRPPAWTDAQLEKAIAAIKSGALIVEASRRFGVSRTTLSRRLHGRR